MPRLTDHRVLTFDCYGTLIDWEGGIWDALQPLIMRGGDSEVTRNAGLLAFAKWEAHHEHESPDLRYPDLLARVHRSIAESLGLETSDALDEAFGASVALWPAFPDTADALRVLKRRYRLVILSNVHRDGFAASNRKLGVEFDAIYTAEDIGSYKPADANFEYMLAHLESDFGLERPDILHTAQSLRHDHAPGEPLRPRQRLDRSTAAVGGRKLGGDEEGRVDADDRLRVLLDGRDGRGGRGRRGVVRTRTTGILRYRRQCGSHRRTPARRRLAGHPLRPRRLPSRQAVRAARERGVSGAQCRWNATPM